MNIVLKFQKLDNRVEIPQYQTPGSSGMDLCAFLEKEITLKYSKETNLVISTGGGIIKNKENILNLMSNGLIVYLTRDEDKLIYSDSRPLTKNKEEYLKLKDQRDPLYKKYASYTIDNSSTTEECVAKIKEAFYEDISY